MDFPKQGGKEPQLRDIVGMQLEENLVAAQFATL
jgi:hypothetical protein